MDISNFLQDSYNKLLNGMDDGLGLGNYNDELALVFKEKELTHNFQTLTHTNGNDLRILLPFSNN